ncbi:MAG: hypothetical protein R3A78_11310 [Polyangiales bacterium]|nr:hypothetical protein [Myxococcales bacterium]
MLRLSLLTLGVALAAIGCAPSQSGTKGDAGPGFDANPGDSGGVTVLTSDPVGRFALGGTHTCWLARGGGIYCWGSNNRGQLGDGTETGRAAPLRVLAIRTAEYLSGKSAQNCAQIHGGQVQCWGSNSHGQLGGATATEFRTSPVGVLSVDDGGSVAVGALHACAVRGAGAVWCWGNNLSGTLGRGTEGSPEKPGVVTNGTGAQAVTAGSSFNCLLSTGGTVSCWGKNTNAQLGDGTTTDRLEPVAVVGLPGSVKAVTAGDAHACALTMDGNVYCWGSNKYGQVGSGSASDANISTPTAVMGIAGDAVAIDAGSQTTCALRTNGNLACWGSNASKQLGDVVDESRASAADVTGMSGVEFFGVGTSHVCAATNTSVFCWGSNSQGQLAIDGDEDVHPTPTLVSLPEDPL